MANTFETAGEYYFKGHEEFGIQSHYGLIGDYYDYGSTFTYVDPAVGTSWSSKCVMNQTITLDDLCRALGEGGYVW